MLAGLTGLLGACHHGGSGGGVATGAAADAPGAPVVNLYTWADYLAPGTVAGFEKQTGIKVRVTTFDTNEVLESRILTGNSGYDVVVPTAPFFERQIRSGAYQPLDRSQLPNLGNMDPQIMGSVAQNDPENAHGVVYLWGTYGVGYNEARVAAALPGVQPDSWRLILDPTYAAKLAGCGIAMLDAPAGVVRLVLAWLGRDPNAPSAADLADAEAALLRIRPYVRSIDTTTITDLLANGDVCVALAYSGDVHQAARRAHEAGNGMRIRYVIPREGSLLWFDMLAIPKDAPHPANAHRLINYLMEPRVIAEVSDFLFYPNGNAAATVLVDPAVRSDPVVYPSPETRQRLFVQRQDPPERARAITRLWQRFKTGQ